MSSSSRFRSPICGAPKPSILRLLKLVALHHTLVVKRIGSLSDPALAQVSTRLHKLL